MINVQINKEANKIVSFSVKGHADADVLGKDVVCASISILSQTAVLALYEVAGIDIIYEMDDGWLYCELPPNLDTKRQEKANVILDSMLVGMKATEEMYSDYIEISYKEV